MTAAHRGARPCRRAAPAQLRRQAAPAAPQRRVKLVWGLLILNVLTFYAGSAMVLPMPAAIGRVDRPRARCWWPCWWCSA